MPSPCPRARAGRTSSATLAATNACRRRVRARRQVAARRKGSLPWPRPSPSCRARVDGAMKALAVHAGSRALARLRERGLSPDDVRIIPAAAGGPKGLVLGPLDQFIFGEWLPSTAHTVHLLGASIGAWRMATACLDEPAAAFAQMAHDY